MTAGTGCESTWKSVKAKFGRQHCTSARGGLLSGDIGRAVSRLSCFLRQLIGIVSFEGAVRDGTDSGKVKGRQSWRLESSRRAECWVSGRISVSTACDRCQPHANLHSGILRYRCAIVLHARACSSNNFVTKRVTTTYPQLRCHKWG